MEARGRQFTFRGELLGASSSRRPNSSRWAEISIFKTVDDEYVVAGVGRSRYDGERDRHWAHVCQTPAAVVEQLHQYDDDNIRYITKVACSALTEAGERDPELLAAFLTENLTPM